MNNSPLNSYLESLELKQLPSAASPSQWGKLLLENNSPFASSTPNQKIKIVANIYSKLSYLENWFKKDLGDLFGSTKEISPAVIPFQDKTFQPLESLEQLPAFSLPGLPLNNYYTSSIIIAPVENGEKMNLSYHRVQKISKNKVVIRVVKRHLYKLLQKNGGKLKTAIVFGASPLVSLAAAYPFRENGTDLQRLGGMNNKPLEVFHLDPLLIPASVNIIVQGKFTGELAPEGPFVDLTGTRDKVREQPVFEVNTIYARFNPILPMILPSESEHALLMGFPRLLALRKAIKPLVNHLRGVSLTPGGSGWLHCVVSCNPKSSIRQIGQTALNTHKSLKRVIIVNEDIDPNNLQEVEWALATRFQPDKDLHLYPGETGSSLDPSSKNSITCKWVCNATIPPDQNPANFKKLI
ncbi:MAG: UbiD family decarboxylase [Deltaproteobacteria bacterium]|jgi:UbiD family decarboxylase|nr:UbiD family decarboxylase [Deltaproteobacteria bacterium]